MPSYRENALDSIRQNGDFDVLVVGGGINGIAAYRDLALQGLRVLLVERHDFASGCSAAPSRMIHGGLRYLENGEFSLVAESLRERDTLLKLAPHMVRPLPTTIPILSTFSGLFNAAASFAGSGGQPTRRGAIAIKIGLLLYDFVTRRSRLLPRHVFRGRKETLSTWPDLSNAVTCSATYHDAWIRHPERLALELILDTERNAPQAIALNYAEIRRSGSVLELSGSEIDVPLSVRPRLIVNATGAWVDCTAAALSGDLKPEKPLVSGTKGSHLIIDNPSLHDALKGHMIFFENADNRVCILFPYLGRVLAGSTDIKIDRPRRVRCEPEERDYILGAVRSVFPGIPVKEQEIVFSFSGIRPLPVSDAAFTGRISRGHFIHRTEGEPCQLCMVGGKWTTFRAFAEQVTDEALKILGKSRIEHTDSRAIGGGQDYPGDTGTLIDLLQKAYRISPARAAYVAEAYGTSGYDLLDFAVSRSDDRPLQSGLETTAAEIAWIIRRERVIALADIVLRRTTLAISGSINLGLIDAIGDVAARELGWSANRAANEREALLDELEHFHGVTPVHLQTRCKELYP